MMFAPPQPVHPPPAAPIVPSIMAPIAAPLPMESSEAQSLQVLDNVEEPTATVVTLDQLGPHTMTVSATGATDSCPNNHIGAIYPQDLEGVTFRGPIDVSRIGSLEEVPVLLGATVPPTSVVVSVTERVGQGAIWNGFIASTPSTPSAILKVTCVSAYASQADGDWEVEEVRKHIVKEILAHRTLQNVSCIPRLLSIWAGVDAEGREYWATMEEDAGRPVDVDTMTVDQKQAVLDAYAAIHQQGVMHNDVKSIHWRFHDDNPAEGVHLIDFSHAVDLNELGADHRRMMCLSEMGDVRQELEADSSGWTKEPYSLVPTPNGSPALGSPAP